MTPVRHKEPFVTRPILNGINDVSCMIQKQFSRKFEICIQTEYENSS